MIERLEKLGKRLKIVLSNSLVVDKNTKQTSDANQDARDRLAKSDSTQWDRIMPNGHIGHNKFLVYVDKNEKPTAVLFGSTNWTATGLCAQTNNTLVIEDKALAKRYLSYWKQLAADTKAANEIAKDLQGAKLRTWDIKGADFGITKGTALESWFSPNTPKARSRSKNEKRPVDMAAVASRIESAEHAFLFLAFNPGTPGIANWSADALRKKKDLFVRGCVTNKGTAETFFYELKGITPPKRKKGDKRPRKEDFRVIGAEAFDGKIIPEGWQKEILNAGFVHPR